MLKHIVFFRFKPDTEEAAIEDVVQSLNALPGTIAEIESLEVGRDVIGSERSYDMALVSAFADLAAMERYQVHPDHQAVITKVKAIAESVVAVDYNV